MKGSTFTFIALLALISYTISSCTKEEEIGYNDLGGTLPTNYIYVTDQSFSPSFVRVAVGSSFTFVNLTGQPHTIASDDLTTIPPHTIAPSTKFYFKKDTVATINYHCVEHPTITGTLELRP